MRSRGLPGSLGMNREHDEQAERAEDQWPALTVRDDADGPSAFAVAACWIGWMGFVGMLAFNVFRH